MKANTVYLYKRRHYTLNGGHLMVSNDQCQTWKLSTIDGTSLQRMKMNNIALDGVEVR